MNLLIDTHSHLDHPLLINKMDEIIERAKNAGLKHIITNGINPETNRICLELSKKYDIVECGMGIYPRDALKKEAETGEAHLDVKDFDIDEEINFIKKNKNNIVAVSEVGLDFVAGESQQQMEDFQKMIQLSEELSKPIVIHSRKAEEKCIAMLESSKNKKIIMHCFSGKKSLVKKIIDNGWFLTIPTVVVRAFQFQENIKLAPITQLFCETDSPYLSPYKEHSNEPSYVIESYKKIAEIKGMDIIEVANNIYMNWQEVFS
ncbi:MAG TPA: TatD family hydrolase [Candidatus Nanoarchaeia archaeon]|nr:TatD family hydrolase [Candidatus Nanoarchaeia archaeon]